MTDRNNQEFIANVIGAICATVFAVAVVAWFAVLGWNEQQKIGDARIACIQSGGVFSGGPVCVWSKGEATK